MEKMWAGRTNGNVNKIADDFNSSIGFDYKLYREDILGSTKHAEMLCKQNIISEKEKNLILEGLESILNDIESGKLEIDKSCEDIHMFIEQVLTNRIGEAGKKLHTARSRNDQVALDIRLYLKNKSLSIIDLLKQLNKVICNVAEKNYKTIMPGYTHLQRAQPISFGHQLMAYAMMFLRDISRLNDAIKRMNVCPLGSCALAGTTYNTDREWTAKELNFDYASKNSIDSVSDRDFCVEILSALSIIMMHLSRFSEEIILWSSYEFNFISLSDEFTTGSSIMPQKKNSDMAELVRGKTGRVYGNLFSILTMLKGLPLAYNKDMQEDKESIFDSLETVTNCLKVFAPMLNTMTVNADKMKKAASEGFINATDLADYLVKKGEPFRSAYKTVGKIVALCITKGITLEKLSLADYKQFDEKFDNDLYNEINLEVCVEKRISKGGTSFNSVIEQINYVRELIK